MKTKPTVGQRLFSLNVGNRARNCPQVLTPVIVSKVGRIYFTTQTDDQWKQEREFHVEDWKQKTIYTPDYVLYVSEQEYTDEKEARTICSQIGKSFEHGRNFQNLSLETLRKIDALINEKTNK